MICCIGINWLLFHDEDFDIGDTLLQWTGHVVGPHSFWFVVLNIQI